MKMDEIIVDVEVQAAEATAAGAKPEKKGDEIMKAPGDYFDRGFSTIFGGGGGSVLRIYRPSLSQSSTIGVCETQTTVSSKPNPEAPIASPSELDPCHLASNPEAPELDPCHLASSPEAPELDPCHLVSSLPQEQVVETQTTTEPKATFAEVAAKITPCHLLESLARRNIRLRRLEEFLNCLGTLLSEVSSFRWDDMFKEPVSSKLFHDVIDLSQIPESFYNITVRWIDSHIVDPLLLSFVFWTFRSITESVWKVHITESVWKVFPGLETLHPLERLFTDKSNVSILVAAALVLRSRPHILLTKMGRLHNLQLHYEQLGALTTPLAVWMIAQVSEGDSLLGLRLWAILLVPLLDRSNGQSKDLILELVENIINKKPDFTVINLHDFTWVFPSFEILLRFTFPATQEATTRRFVAIYPFFKDLFLVSAPQYLFRFCLRLDNQGNPDVAKEATEIALWCLTQEVDCWEELWGQWEDLCNTENLETSSVALLKRLVEKLKDHSLQLSFLSPSRIHALTKHWRKRNNIKKVSFSQKIFEEAMEQEVNLQQVKIFTQKLLTFSLRLAGEGNSVLAKEATEIAIWSLTESVVWWKLWECLYKEKLEATSVAILKKLVEKWKDHSLKLSSWSLNHTLAHAPDTKEMQLRVTQKIFTEKIFTFSLRIAGRGNPDLAKEAIEMAIWSLMENVDCWKHWEYLYKKNLEASVALLKKLVEKWKDRSLKPSSSPSDTLEKIYTLSLRLAGEAKEAAEIAMWSLAEKNDPYKKNRKAVFALLKSL